MIVLAFIGQRNTNQTHFLCNEEANTEIVEKKKERKQKKNVSGLVSNY
jgi:hypothetical protein